MSAFFKRLKNDGGQITMGLLATVVIAGAIYLIIEVQRRFTSDTNSRVETIKVPVNVRSGIETMIAALRQAEVEYIKKVSVDLGCISANTFVDALKFGTNCTGGPNPNHSSFSIFNDSSAPGVVARLYNHASVCTISRTSGCIDSKPTVVEIGVPYLLSTKSDPIGNLQFSFSLMRVDTDLKVLNIRADVQKKNGAKKVFEIYFRDSNINMAHMDADGTVRQSNPNPNDLCKDPNPNNRLPYSELKVFDESDYTCKSFSQLGGGTGLIYYRGRYFSFRPSDGQIFDLKESSNPSSPYFPVSEGGYIGGTKVFLPYKKDILFNADDLTIIEDQIYYIKGQTSNLAIYALVNPGNPTNHSKKVCDLAALGWSQASVGLSSKAWSDRLIPSTPSSDPRMATFYVKTFSGDMLTALVWSTNQPPPNDFKCVVLKDSAIQEVENKRTYGFDKVVTDKSFIFW